MPNNQEIDALRTSLTAVRTELAAARAELDAVHADLGDTVARNIELASAARQTESAQQSVAAVRAELAAMRADLTAAVTRNVELEASAQAEEDLVQVLVHNAARHLCENAEYLHQAAAVISRALAYLDTHPMAGSRDVAKAARALLAGPSVPR